MSTKRIPYTTDGTALRVEMAKRGITTITELAKISGIGRGTAAGVLTGEIKPSYDVMVKIIKGLDIPPEVAGPIFFKRDLPE